MTLTNKNAVIYGAGGDVGTAVAREFARAGARVILAGRDLAKLEAIAAEICAGGGSASAAKVDALDEEAVARFVEQAGAIDISFCAIGLGNTVPKAPLVELAVEDFMRPIVTYTRANFVTARCAARHMVARRSGVILTITATPSRLAFPNAGGSGPAYAAITALTRSLSVELGPHGIRVVGIMPNAIPESSTIRDNFAKYAKAAKIPPAEYLARMESTTHLRRLTSLAEVAAAAQFLVSDRASAMTGTILNLSGGGVLD